MSFSYKYAELRRKRQLEESVKKSAEKKKTQSSTTSFDKKYSELRSERLAEEAERDIAPVVTTRKTTYEAPITTKKDKEEKKRSWFQKGAFEDGYDFGDVTKTILGTVADVSENIGTGIIGMGEKVADTAVGLGSLIAKNSKYSNPAYSSLDPKTKKWVDNANITAAKSMKEFVAKDLYDEEKVAKAIISNPLKTVTGIDADEDSVLGEKTDSLMQSGGQLLGTVGLQAVGVPWFVTTGITSYGGELEGALNEGATIEEASLSAAISSGAEILTEKISGGISFGGKTLDDALTKQISRGISNKVVRTLAKLGIDMAGEGAEEVLSGAMGAIGQKMTYAKDKELSELFSSEEALESFIGGAVLGGFGSGVQAVKSNKAGIDYVTELTENEQKVVDKVYEDRVTEAEENGKLTKKAKAKIYDDVLRDLDKGYITTDTIESILGGDTYKSYKDTVDSEDALKQELDELRKMKNGDRNDIQNDRLAELKAMNLEDTTKRDSLRKQLNEEVFGLVNNSRLAESYNEQTRRGQYFEADLSKYDKKYQDTIQKAINSKILNNSNRTHELVDMIAKISADKGVSFDFTNNAKLKESGFAVDGKTVNGFVTKDGITLNTDSAKYLNSVVGHEVTHVLEGTELYTELQNTLVEYAKTKNDYQGRIDSLTELYKGVEGADINAELTADLVGDYLFTDSDFINKLSTEHRNVFQKVYDEIKYLYKVATAGSKEARELEKVKREFEKVYQGEINEKNDLDIRYSLSKAGDSIDKYTQVQYNDFGWARANGAISKNELDDMYSKIHEKGSLANFKKSTYGEAIIEVNDNPHTTLGVDNVFVFVTGTKTNPQINRVVRFQVETETEMEIIKEKLYERGSFSNTYYSFLRQERLAREYSKKSSLNYSEYTQNIWRGSSGAESYGADGTRGNEQYGSRTFEETRSDEVAQSKKTSSTDGVFFDANKKAYSLSDKVEAPTKYGNYNVSSDEVKYQSKDIGPVREDITKEQTSVIPNDYAPITEGEANALQSELFATLDDVEAPPESNTEYYEQPDTTRLDVKAEKELVNTLKEMLTLDAKETKAMQDIIQRYSTAEFPSEAALFREVKDNFGERTWTTKDELSAEVKDYLRKTKVSVSQTIRGDIPNFNNYRKKNCWGKVRVNKEGTPVDSLYMELTELYPSFFPEDIINPTEQFERMVEVANTDYDNVEGYKLEDQEIQGVVNFITSEISKYKESEVMRTAEADRQAFMNEITKGKVKAPIKETEVKKTAKTENVEAPVKEAKIAEIVTNEPEATKPKGRTLSQARMLLSDKQAPFEDLSLKTGNRELMAKADYLHRVEGAAQRFIGKGTDGVRALLDVKAEVEKSGLNKEFQDYMYHSLNVDRMSIESNAKKKIDSLQGKFGNLKLKQIQAIAATKITDKTTERTAQTVREAREYLDSLNAHNKAVFGDSMTADMSRAKVAKAEKKHPEFKRWAKEVYGITEHLRKMLVDGDVLSQETADRFASIYPHYVPIRRLDKEGAAINVPLDTRKTGVNAPIKRATGGNSTIGDMWKTLALRTEQTYKAVARNSLGIELKNTLGADGIKKTATVDEINESFDNHEELLKKGENGMNPTFTIFENGKRVEFEITEDLYDALKPQNDFLAKEIKPFSTAMKIQRGILTEYNPVFSATNAIKDAQSVVVNSQHPIETYMNFPEALILLSNNAITKKAGTYLKEYLEHGGEDLTYFDSNKKAFSKDDTGIKKVLGFVPRKISEANNFIEKIPRLAEYIASRKKGASIEVAMLDAARVTTNFAAGGDLAKFANRNGFTFLNASIQGFNQQVRNIREAKANGLKGMLQLGAKYAVAGLPVLLLNHLFWEDDEEYEELSDYIKDNYYIVGKTQDGKFIRIPKGREVAVIQNAFEQMKNLITGDDEVDMSRFGELLVENIAPNNPLTNNIFAPIIQAHTNTAWYGGDLVPTRLQDLPNAEQYDESTDAISKWLGEKTNLSPYRLNYLLDQYSGGIGDIFLPMLTPESDGGGILAPVKDKFTTDGVLKNQNVSDFYDTKDKLTTNAKSSKATDEDILKSKYMNSVSAELGELYALKREIQNSDLSDEEKYSSVRDVQSQIVDLTRESLSNVDSVSINGGYATVGNLHYKLNKEGEWEKITDKQLEKQEDVTSGLGISAEEYWSNKTEYDFAYESPEKYQVARAVGGYDAYKTYSSELYDIKADKDENGKSINGSRKEKVVEYINNLDADYGEKIILFKSEYNADDTYNYEIVDYLNSRDDISREEMETILKELGFDVSSDGSISWD